MCPTRENPPSITSYGKGLLLELQHQCQQSYHLRETHFEGVKEPYGNFQNEVSTHLTSRQKPACFLGNGDQHTAWKPTMSTYETQKSWKFPQVEREKKFPTMFKFCSSLSPPKLPPSSVSIWQFASEQRTLQNAPQAVCLSRKVTEGRWDWVSSLLISTELC